MKNYEKVNEDLKLHAIHCLTKLLGPLLALKFMRLSIVCFLKSSIEEISYLFRLTKKFINFSSSLSFIRIFSKSSPISLVTLKTCLE